MLKIFKVIETPKSFELHLYLQGQKMRLKLKNHPGHNVQLDLVLNIGWRIDTHNVDALR